MNKTLVICLGEQRGNFEGTERRTRENRGGSEGTERKYGLNIEEEWR